MRIDPLNKLHVLSVAQNAPERNHIDMRNVLDSLSLYTMPKRGFACVEKGEVYLVGGIIPVWDGVGEAWIIPSKKMGERKIAASRWMRIAFDHLFDELKLHRAQAYADASFTEACRVLEWVGMEKEGIMRKYGSDGRDHYRYAKVK